MKKLKDAFGGKQIPLLSAKAARQTDAVQVSVADPKEENAFQISLRDQKLSASGRLYLTPKACKDILDRSAIRDENAAKILQKVVAKMPAK